jgi:starch synthase
MDGVIGTRLEHLHGLINGIDTAVWNPAIDRNLPARYQASDLAGKLLCRAALLGEFGWNPKFKGPVFGMVCRFTPAKGLDFVLGAKEFFARENCRLVILGGGEKKYEQAFRELATAHAGKIGVCVRLDEAMSHLVEAGADFFLMPSLFEPCGLNQMYSQAYGTVPIVSKVGGLVDTVVDIEAGADTGTGIMTVPKQEDFVAALHRAMALYADKARYAAVQQRAMARDFSWTKAVAAYEQLYAAAL